ncbi:hypothetical protein BSZ39_01775 [Bowdeniella nasicola]|uniref:ABC3 transporter permease C-terminal domain-containing protein n=1 Tax=Bowdeniella nasicola TaxID=208480 RepID=A0A1Q5Q4U9_9ACTO|nr:FtsX-like permease family protein [Bowdeniella nasicola]OKL54836.1 hypothetical protein BSZ39_01775 [Bowdeniella nasicola]
MRARQLMREAWRSAISSKVSSLLVALVVGATCFIALTTVGRNAANEAALLAEFEGVGARQITVINSSEQDYINPATLATVAHLRGVQQAAALGRTTDVTNGAIPGTPATPLWPVYGEIADVAPLVAGRAPGPGEAIIGVSALDRLRFAAPSGFVQSQAGAQYPVVGMFQATAPFEDLNEGILIRAEDDTRLTQLRVVVGEMENVRATQSAIVSVLAPQDASKMQLRSGRDLVEQAFTLGGLTAQFGRATFLLILGVGALFVSSVVLSDVLVRRRDLGRRRALGCSRASLVALVVARNVAAGIVGAAIGCLIALGLGARSGVLPPVSFVVAVAVLALITCILASLPPAVFAAHRDPVRVLRTP